MLGSGLDGLSMFCKIGIVPMNEPILLQIFGMVDQKLEEDLTPNLL
jgi:hypothetical protein